MEWMFNVAEKWKYKYLKIVLKHSIRVNILSYIPSLNSMKRFYSDFTHSAFI